MKLSRTTLIGLALAVAAVVLACVIFNRSTPDQDSVAGGGKGGSKANFSGSAAQPAPPKKTPRPEIVDRKALAAKELELLWARGLSQELVVELDRVSAMKDPEYWREIGPLLIKQAAKEGRPDIANYMLVTSDASPDENLRIQIYAAAMENPDEEIRDTAKLELENITGEQFATGDAARAWLAANPQPGPDEEEIPEGQ
ncbi:hypothetical protein [Luteolibacter soli]|uniref:HEAT repeat domain-containing protein n=1 Tax=Luteolibacter soli TaxID=3135280 RepID=A0ABU9AZ15_9BACT